MPFRIALSGLNAAQTDLSVTANNIANTSTNGLKGSRAEFADLFAVSLQGVSAAPPAAVSASPPSRSSSPRAISIHRFEPGPRGQRLGHVHPQ
jgi:flagellar hook protein FlgE